MNGDFNEKLQGDSTTVYIDGDKFEVLNLVDELTGYGEGCIVKGRNYNFMMYSYETSYIWRHGKPS